MKLLFMRKFPCMNDGIFLAEQQEIPFITSNQEDNLEVCFMDTFSKYKDI